MKMPTRITFWFCCLAWLLAFPASGNAAWFTNQSAVTGGSPCAQYSSSTRGATFSSMTAGQAYPMEAGQACGSATCTGSSDTANWNYLITGNVAVKNTADTSTTLTITGYTGTNCTVTGTWPNLTFTGCFADTLYSGAIGAGETKAVPWRQFNLLQPYNATDYFFVTATLSGVGSCVEGDFTSWEHD